VGGSGATTSTGAVPSFAFPGNFLLGSVAASQKLDFLGTARGRVGYFITPSALFYGTGGIAYGRITFNGSTQVLNATAAAAVVSASGGLTAFADTRLGWTVGGGVEWMFIPNWSVKGEYLYYDLGAYSVSTPQATLAVPGGPASGFAATSFHGRASGQTVRAGLNYHFNFGEEAPVVAKY